MDNATKRYLVAILLGGPVFCLSPFIISIVATPFTWAYYSAFGADDQLIPKKVVAYLTVIGLFVPPGLVVYWVVFKLFPDKKGPNKLVQPKSSARA